RRARVHAAVPRDPSGAPAGRRDDVQVGVVAHVRRVGDLGARRRPRRQDVDRTVAGDGVDAVTVEVHGEDPAAGRAALARPGDEHQLRPEEPVLAGEVLDDVVAPHVRELADVGLATLVGPLEDGALALLDLVEPEVDDDLLAAHLGAELHHAVGAGLLPLGGHDRHLFGAYVGAVLALGHDLEPAGDA